MESLKKTGLDLMREPFPATNISKLPKPTKKKEEMDKLPKAQCSECGGYHQTSGIIHLDYVGHAALTNRLLNCDTGWYWEPLAYGADGLPSFDKSGGLWIKLTVCGVTRIGYGNATGTAWQDAGAREKEVIGDALRNAAMRFGAALELWHKGQLDIEENGDIDSEQTLQTWRDELTNISTADACRAFFTRVNKFCSDNGLVAEWNTIKSEINKKGESLAPQKKQAAA